MLRQGSWRSTLAAMALLLTATVAAGDDQPAQNLASSYAPLIEKAAPAVVNIYTRKIVRSRSLARSLDGSAFWRLFRDTLLFGYGQARIENSLGSGVIVAADGIIVTNHHVVTGAGGILVALTDGRVFEAKVLLSDPRTDIAVLRVDAGSPLPFLEFGDSENLRVGDPVVAIGNPFGLGQTVTTGIVSALARTTFGAGDFRFYIQTDAAINPGNSGGAQIAMDGKLIGINTAIYTTSGGSQGLGFAIPSNMVRPIVESAIMGKPVIHPWIGMSGRNIPPGAARLLGLAGSRGVLITEIYPGGPADRSGFTAGDVVLALDGKPASDPQALRYRIATQRPGTTVRLTTVRGGKIYEVPVTALAPPDLPARDETTLRGLSPLRGARVASLSPALAEELGADSALTGVVVLEVGQASAADRLGLRSGDIIRAIDARQIASVAEIGAFRPMPFRPWSLAVSRAGENLALRKPAEVSFLP
ncbi:MAG: Do family serine endopeptidase [Rhizobiales bacterium]|nr:Do family serine endopeptidase [Hyphomicrobiales bacterium]